MTITQIKSQRAFAFIFNADIPSFGGCYGDPCDSAFFRSLLNSDYSYEVHTSILRGDLMLYSICENITRISYKDNQISKTINTNRALYTSLVWDLSEAISGQWHSLDCESFPLLIGSHNLYCITTPNLSITIPIKIDKRLKHAPGYIGAVQIDQSNPLQLKLFIQSLIGGLALKGRTLYVLSSEPKDETYVPSWINDVAFKSVQVVDSNEYEEQVPRLSTNIALSERGKITQLIINKKGESSHRQRVANELYFSGIATLAKYEPFEFSTMTEAKFDEVVVSQEKLVNYALNPDHPEGKHKALLFRRELCITMKEWRYLASQLILGLRKVKLQRVRSEKFGIMYQADIPILGLNGQSKIVRSAWIISGGQPARLVSAFLAPRNEQTGERGEVPPIVDSSLDGNAKWTRLLELARAAGIKASKDIIPTPMVVQWNNKHEVIDEGVCGGAYVVVSNARNGFARWLRASHVGEPTTPSGQGIFAESAGQSKERAESYAHAFANVLKMNGVECTVKAYYT
jgi:hypothetical protein